MENAFEGSIIGDHHSQVSAGGSNVPHRQVARSPAKFIEDQIVFEQMRLIKHREAVEKLMSSEDVTFVPQISKKSIEIAK